MTTGKGNVDNVCPSWLMQAPPPSFEALRPHPMLAKKHDLLEGMTAEERKKYPVKSGFLDYFRDAIFAVANVSHVGNEQHNPGQPVHWAREKSADHGDCEARHLLCSDQEEHLKAKAWRAMADLQIFLEERYNIKPPPGAK